MGAAFLLAEAMVAVLVSQVMGVAAVGLAAEQ